MKTKQQTLNVYTKEKIDEQLNALNTDLNTKITTLDTKVDTEVTNIKDTVIPKATVKYANGIASPWDKLEIYRPISINKLKNYKIVLQNKRDGTSVTTVYEEGSSQSTGYSTFPLQFYNLSDQCENITDWKNGIFCYKLRFTQTKGPTVKDLDGDPITRVYDITGSLPLIGQGVPTTVDEHNIIGTNVVLSNSAIGVWSTEHLKIRLVLKSNEILCLLLYHYTRDAESFQQTYTFEFDGQNSQIMYIPLVNINN